MKRFVAPIVALVSSLALAGPSGGYISGTVNLPKSVTAWDKVIVLVCAESNPMCDQPVSVFKPKPAFPGARSAPFVSPKLEAGRYTVYAMNDKNDNATHDHETEELGGVFKEGSFDAILLEPTVRGLKIDMIGM